MKLYTFKIVRAICLPLLKGLAFDFSITHHWTGDVIRLNSFRHKGYWFHGKNRERETMRAFENMISSGETIAEVGGHIGYLTLWFAKIVGPTGSVFVFEPGGNNLPYIRRNVSGKRNVVLTEKGCGPEKAVLNFYEDNLTGQNNSFVKDFAGLDGNARNAPGVAVEVETRQVEICRLDAFFRDIKRAVSFVKIDTEGYELNVLLGCSGLFDQTLPPKFMVEVQADEKAIFELFTERGYFIFNSSRERIETVDKMTDNLFMLHSVHHAVVIKGWLAGDF